MRSRGRSSTCPVRRERRLTAARVDQFVTARARHAGAATRCVQRSDKLEYSFVKHRAAVARYGTLKANVSEARDAARPWTPWKHSRRWRSFTPPRNAPPRRALADARKTNRTCRRSTRRMELVRRKDTVRLAYASGRACSTNYYAHYMFANLSGNADPRCSRRSRNRRYVSEAQLNSSGRISCSVKCDANRSRRGCRRAAQIARFASSATACGTRAAGLAPTLRSTPRRGAEARRGTGDGDDRQQRRSAADHRHDSARRAAAAAALTAIARASSFGCGRRETPGFLRKRRSGDASPAPGGAQHGFIA